MLRSICFIFLIVDLTLVGWIVEAQSTPEFQPIFNQDENKRNARSKKMLSYMNPKADPCEDFYEYACGNYAKQETIKPRTKPAAEESMESQLGARIASDLQSMLEEQVTLEDGITGRTVKEFYKSCVSAVNNGPQQQEYFSKFIKENGGFPAVPGASWNNDNNYKWEQVVGHLHHKYGMDILVAVEVDFNYENTNENSIYIGEPSTIIPTDLCSMDGTKRVDIRDQEYEVVEKGVAEKLMKWLTMSATDAKKVAAELVTFEYELCTAMEGKSRGRSRTEMRVEVQTNLNYTRKTLAQFSDQYNNIIDFNEIVSTAFALPVFKPVFMSSPQYFLQLVKTIQHHSIPTVVNYIMYRALSELSFPANDHPSRRAKFCVNQVKRLSPNILSNMYYQKYGNILAKEDIETIFQQVKWAFRNSLENNWIMKETSRVAKQKLNEIQLVFPQYENALIQNIHMNRSNYWNNLEKMNELAQNPDRIRLYEMGLPKPRDPIESYDQRIQYRPLHRQVEMSWALLQPPFYEGVFPNSLKYAMIGFRLARELSFAFDQYAWNATRLGYSKWDRFTAGRYKNRSICFQQHMSNYIFNNPDQFENQTQLEGAIANSIGLNTAFNAYLRWLSFRSPSNEYSTLRKETLADLNLTNTQLFFLSFAQMNCHNEGQKWLPPFLPMARHTMVRYMVNGPLSNSDEFAKDFNCLVGSEMNPTDKCFIY